MLQAILNIVVLAVVITVIAEAMPSIKLKSFGTAVVVSLVYSLVHFLLFGLLRFLSFPLIFISFGLFIFVINAFLLWLTDLLIEDFEILGVKNLVIVSVLITLCSLLLKWIF